MDDSTKPTSNLLAADGDNNDDDKVAVASFAPPSKPFLVAFDVNNFLKKTFSDYDIGHDDEDERNLDADGPSSSIDLQRVEEQRGRRRSEKLLEHDRITYADNNGENGHHRRRNHQQRRAGSVPTAASSGRRSNGNEPSADDPNLDDDQNGRPSSTHKSRRSKKHRREEETTQMNHSSCAYCGHSIDGRRNSTRGGLYCAACTSFFTRHSPSELQRRIAFDEMTQPTGFAATFAAAAANPRVDVGSSSGIGNGDNKETVPLLCGGASDSHRVVIVGDGDREGVEEEDDVEVEDEGDDCENTDPLRTSDDTDGQQQPSGEEVEEEVSSNRYTRNERPYGRGHANRLQVKANRQTQHRQHQQFRSSGRVQLRGGEPTTVKMSPWCGGGGGGESASVVVWNQDNQGNNGGSRRDSFTSASSLNRPTCRICHLYGEPGDNLVSPCRCSGTVQYVHTTCLVHWLEISTKKVLPSPHCELCGYHYRTHHCYRFRRMQAPTCNHRDRVLHTIFVFMLLLMVGCAALSAVYLRQDKSNGIRPTARVALNSDDILVIASALLFFCAFFVAVFTQYRAETSVCRLCLRCWMINRHWRVKDYDRRLDYDRQGKSAHAVVMEQV